MRLKRRIPTIGDDALSKWPVWLRWLLFVPAALLAAGLIQLVIILLSGLSETWLSWLPAWAIQLINSVASGFAFVLVLGWMAPRGKVIAAVVGTVLVALVVGILIIVGLLLPTKDGPLLVLLGGVLTLVGAGAACWQTYEHESETRRAALAE
jgi:hypothetical protein